MKTLNMVIEFEKLWKKLFKFSENFKLKNAFYKTKLKKRKKLIFLPISF